MFKKVISVLVALVMCASFVSVFADSVFDDVTEKNYSWAVKEIEEMADMGIISGYGNGKFGPADSVTKLQSLLLCSRILGYADENNILFVEKALELFGAQLSENYGAQYAGEIAYLLYKGVLTSRELPAYLSEDNSTLPLKRYEAAVLMTKVMGAEEDAEDLISGNVFTDAADIPASAKPYVNYVNSIGLMTGVNKTDLVNEFAPLMNVNRAQMAVMLYRMMGIMKSETIFGVVDSVNIVNETLTYSPESGFAEVLSYSTLRDAIVYVDGYVADFSDIEPQAVLAITERDGKVYMVEAINIKGDETVVGVVTNVTTSTSKSTISVRGVNESKEKVYKIADKASVIIDGSPSVARLVKTGMYVTLEISNDEVIMIAAEQKSKAIVGTVKGIILTPSAGLEIETASDGVLEYVFAKDAEATRNGKSVLASEILVGDRVSITLTYDQISKVVATSTNYNATGTIDKILIATLPQITITSGGVQETYSVSRDASYVIDGKEGTIYDLRLGGNVTLSVQGETVVKVTSTAPVTSSVLVGTIETVNTAYGFMVISSEKSDGSVEQTQVFLRKTGMTVLDSKKGSTVSTSALKVGMLVSVTGAMNMGAFEATTITIIE